MKIFWSERIEELNFGAESFRQLLELEKDIKNNLGFSLLTLLHEYPLLRIRLLKSYPELRRRNWIILNKSKINDFHAEKFYFLVNWGFILILTAVKNKFDDS